MGSNRPDPPEPPGEVIARQVAAKGVADPRVLAALRLVPRPQFLPPEVRDHALDDAAVQIGHGQTISQPYMVAVMSAELDVHPDHRVLEIGTGSGYQAAVLAHLARVVFTVERHAPLSAQARRVLDELGLTNVAYHVGDGTLGWPGHAPYDRILVTAGTPVFPAALFDQLVEGGRLIAPIGNQDVQAITVIRKQNGRPVEQRGMSCRFVKLIGAQGWTADAGEGPEPPDVPT